MSSAIRIAIARPVTAFSRQAIGSKVVDESKFWKLLERAVAEHDFSGDWVPGQGRIVLPEDALSAVTSEVGRFSENPDHYVVRDYLGLGASYLNRKYARPAKKVEARVLTRAAYVADPDILADKDEYGRIIGSNATHVLVSVRASPEQPPRFDVEPLVRALASSARPTLAWTIQNVRVIAKQSFKYASDWSLVADETEVGPTSLAEVLSGWNRSATLIEFLSSFVGERGMNRHLSIDELRIAAREVLERLIAKK